MNILTRLLFFYCSWGFLYYHLWKMRAKKGKKTLKPNSNGRHWDSSSATAATTKLVKIDLGTKDKFESCMNFNHLVKYASVKICSVEEILLDLNPSQLLSMNTLLQDVITEVTTDLWEPTTAIAQSGLSFSMLTLLFKIACSEVAGEVTEKDAALVKTE